MDYCMCCHGDGYTNIQSPEGRLRMDSIVNEEGKLERIYLVSLCACVAGLKAQRAVKMFNNKIEAHFEKDPHAVYLTRKQLDAIEKLNGGMMI